MKRQANNLKGIHKNTELVNKISEMGMGMSNPITSKSIKKKHASADPKLGTLKNFITETYGSFNGTLDEYVDYVHTNYSQNSNYNSIVKTINKFGLNKPNVEQWTMEEIDYILKYYKDYKGSSEEFTEMFNNEFNSNKSVEAIKNKYSDWTGESISVENTPKKRKSGRTGCTSSRWTKAETEYLLKNYPNFIGYNKEFAEQFNNEFGTNRTPESFRHRYLRCIGKYGGLKDTKAAAILDKAQEDVKPAEVIEAPEIITEQVVEIKENFFKKVLHSIGKKLMNI